MTTTSTDHGFIALPRELRDIIYTQVLAPTKNIEFYLRQNTNCRLRIRPSNPPMTPPLHSHMAEYHTWSARNL